MLKSRVLTDVLAQANSEGIKSTLLLNPDGALVGFAGGSESSARRDAAVAANVWVAYERHQGEGLAKRRGASLASAGSAANEAGAVASASHQVASPTQSSTSPGAVVGATGVPRDEEGLRSVVVVCENGTISMASVAGMLLCLVASDTVEFGVLKAKVCSHIPSKVPLTLQSFHRQRP
ncbi:hypothetical protein HDU98_009960 [Podochytrium sp. JEL0797]|nr:hypothetical protein HDU98_009960 [Podochytrium sp. JEL0797]